MYKQGGIMAKGQHLTKAAFAQAGQYLKAVADVITHNHAQISPLVIIPATLTRVVWPESCSRKLLQLSVAQMCDMSRQHMCVRSAYSIKRDRCSPTTLKATVIYSCNSCWQHVSQ